VLLFWLFIQASGSDGGVPFPSSSFNHDEHYSAHECGMFNTHMNTIKYKKCVMQQEVRYFYEVHELQPEWLGPLVVLMLIDK